MCVYVYRELPRHPTTPNLRSIHPKTIFIKLYTHSKWYNNRAMLLQQCGIIIHI